MNFNIESIKSDIRIEQISNDVFNEESFSCNSINDYIENNQNFSIIELNNEKTHSHSKNSKRKSSQCFINEIQIKNKDNSTQIKQRKSCILSSDIGRFSQTFAENLISNNKYNRQLSSSQHKDINQNTLKTPTKDPFKFNNQKPVSIKQFSQK